VRRFYPFTPLLGAKTRKEFNWNGWRFPEGVSVALDAYGINHEARSRESPDEFWPERFETRPPGPFDFVPQGGGTHLGSHRCAGEDLTVAALEVATETLTKQITFSVPAQDFGFSLSRMPTFPAGGMLIEKVTCLSAP
jgi:fatty-acid peroxygenase